MLGLSISSVRPRSTLVMVERSGVRRKADRQLRGTERNFHRVRMDIRHCAVPFLPGVYHRSGSSDSSDVHCNMDDDVPLRSLKKLRVGEFF